MPQIAKYLILLVGATGFEPATPCAQGRCATRLRYAPTFFLYHEGEIGDKNNMRNNMGMRNSERGISTTHREEELLVAGYVLLVSVP